MHILIIEDETTIAELLSNIINDEFNLPSHVVDTNRDAIKDFDSAIPVLVLLDYLLPDGACDGFITHCRASPDCPPIILISAAGARAKECMATYGLRAYLAKPFSLDALIEVIKTCLVV